MEPHNPPNLFQRFRGRLKSWDPRTRSKNQGLVPLNSNAPSPPVAQAKSDPPATSPQQALSPAVITLSPSSSAVISPRASNLPAILPPTTSPHIPPPSLTASAELDNPITPSQAIPSSPVISPSPPGLGAFSPGTSDSPAVSPILPNPAALSQNTPNRKAPSTPSLETLTKTLWEEAVDKLRLKDRDAFDFSASDKLNTLEELIKETKAKRDECKKKKWKYTSYLDDLLDQLGKFATIGDSIIKNSPSIAAIPWAGFRFLLQLSLNDIEIMKSILLALEYIAHTINRCAVYEQLYVKIPNQSRSASNLTASLPDLYAAILTYLCESKAFFTQKTPVRVLNSTWDPYIVRFKPLMENIKNQEFTVENNARAAASEYQFTKAEQFDALQQEHATKLQEILESVKMPIIRKELQELQEGIEKNFQDTQRQETLRWLSEVTFEEHHNFIKSKRHPGSGEWLLNKKEFIGWKESAESSILWLHGNAGAGKTNLASAVVDRFEITRREAGAVAYFYCRYDQEERRNPASILSALVKQLSTTKPGSKLPEPVAKIYKDRKDGGFKSNVLTVEESKKLLIELTADYELTIISIDALDECDRDTRDELLDALKDILSQSSRVVKIFVTSRDDQDIVLNLDGLPNVRIRSDDNSGDIERFVNEEIVSLISRKKILHGLVDDELRDSIISTLIKHADGMFLWVGLQIQSLCREKTRSDLETALTEIPAGLEQTFSVILGRIENQTKRSKCRARKALNLILGAQRPLSSSELIDALAIESTVGGQKRPDKPTISVILDECQNFVIIDEKLDVFRFAHLSVNDFLKTSTSEPEVHTKLAEICLLSFLQRDWEAGFLRYALEYWDMHIRVSCNGGSSPLIGLQTKLFKSSLVFSELIEKLPSRYWIDNIYGMKKATPLQISCAYGLEYIYRFLLGMGANPDSNTEEGRTLLLLAALGGHDAVVELLLGRTDVEVNCKDNNGETPLIHAARSGHEAVVKLLLGRTDIDVNCKGNNGETPLIRAAWSGHEAVVKLLLGRSDIEVNCKDSNGLTPLIRAAWSGHEAVVKLLLGRSDIDVNCKDSDGRTPLIRAAWSGHEAVVKLLLGRTDIEVNCKDSNGEIPLIRAAKNGHEAVVKLLLGRTDIDVNCKDSDGRTPLIRAAWSGHEAVVKLLLGRTDIDVNCKDSNGLTPLIRAAWSGHEAVVKLLLGRTDIEVNFKDNHGWTPLIHAAKNGHEAVVKLLLGRTDIEVNCKDSNGETPLIRAAKNGHEAVVKLLLGKPGIEVNCKDGDGWTPLIHAVENGCEKVVEQLLAKPDLDLNYKHPNGDTLLAISISRSYRAIEKLLTAAAVSR